MIWHPIAAAAVLTATLASTSAAAPPPPDPDLEVLEIDRERYDRMTVPVTIQGQGPYDFLIDTAAQATVLSRALPDELQRFER